MTSITGKTKLITASLVSVGAYLFYYYYQKNNTFSISKPMTDDDVREKFKKAGQNYGKGDQKYKGIYLYSTESDSLYLRSTDGNLYTAGKLSKCPFILDPKNTVTSYDITDIYETFKCSGIPDKYKDMYKADCEKDPNNDISILITSAKDFEKSIKDNSKGEITPDQNVCFDNTQGGNTIGDAGIKPASNIKEFVESNTEKITEFVMQGGEIYAVSKVSTMFVMGAFIIPGIINSTGWEQTKQSLMGGQILVHEVLPWILEKSQAALSKAIENFGKESIDLAEGSIIKAAQDMAVVALEGITIALSKLVVMALESLSAILGPIGAIQIIGMFIDIFDWCKLNNINTRITQNILDDLAKGNDMAYNMVAGYGVMGQPWNPIYNYCDYDLEPNLCTMKYNNCKKQTFMKGQKWGDGKKFLKSDGYQTEISESEYCADIGTGKDTKFSKYCNDYINNLKVNYLGQCIKITTNDELADILQLYLPQFDWSSVRSINKDNYPLDLYPKSQDAKILSIFIVNQNTYVAEFIKNNFYYFLSFFIIILLIIFLF